MNCHPPLPKIGLNESGTYEILNFHGVPYLQDLMVKILVQISVFRRTEPFFTLPTEGIMVLSFIRLTRKLVAYNWWAINLYAVTGHEILYRYQIGNTF